MNWIRTRTKRTSGLALFALAIQFALSFGHFHSFHLSSRTGASAAVAVVSAPDQGIPDHDDYYCDICAVTALANATIAASAPALPLPDLVLGTRIANSAAFGLVETRRVAFQQRAPPIG